MGRHVYQTNEQKMQDFEIRKDPLYKKAGPGTKVVLVFNDGRKQLVTIKSGPSKHWPPRFTIHEYDYIFNLDTSYSSTKKGVARVKGYGRYDLIRLPKPGETEASIKRENKAMDDKKQKESQEKELQARTVQLKIETESAHTNPSPILRVEDTEYGNVYHLKLIDKSGNVALAWARFCVAKLRDWNSSKDIEGLKFDVVGIVVQVVKNTFISNQIRADGECTTVEDGIKQIVVWNWR